MSSSAERSRISELGSREILCALFEAAVSAAQPARTITRFLPEHEGRILILGAGKAAAAMASAVEAHWPDRPLEGLVITPYGYATSCQSVEVVEASHPIPDSFGEGATRRLLRLAQSAGDSDLVVFLISGGASAVLSLPAHPISLADKQQVTAHLLRSGVPISGINCVRKHLSAIKGGRLGAAAARARQLTLLISDVPGDEPSLIGSGPTIADPSTLSEALEVLARYKVPISRNVSAYLGDAANETPKPGDPRFARAEYHVIATPMMALSAAADLARGYGIIPIIVGDAIEGEACEVANMMAEQVFSQKSHKPIVFLSGGELTVAVHGDGRGGPNTEFLLSLALALDDLLGVYAIACDTDGVDGNQSYAGAIITPDTLSRARSANIDLRSLLQSNNSHAAFLALGDLVHSGPTFTNVNDFRAILVT